MKEAPARYDTVIEELRAAYNGSAARRDEQPTADWKLIERKAFLDRLREDETRLLEVGAGTGHDSLFFQEEGLDVVATDLAPEMVERCRAKGLQAHVMDFLNLDFPPASFDAVYAINCLLHVPNADLPAVLAAIHGVLNVGGLLFLGVYGGEPFEGVDPEDWHDPPRFFSFRSDEQIQAFARERFDLIDFHTLESDSHFRFQSLTVRARPSSMATVV
jgi:SAM-dependent methyltransferase